MLWGMAISGKRYGFGDWMVALLVTFGVATFLLTGTIEAPHHSRSEGSIYGLLLLTAFLGLDGFTSTFQERIFRESKGAMSKYNQMLYVAGCSTLTSLGSLVVSGTLLPSLSFGASHPGFVYDVACLSIASASAQFFIYSMLKEVGALALAATMNVRQMLSIVFSV